MASQRTRSEDLDTFKGKPVLHRTFKMPRAPGTDSKAAKKSAKIDSFFKPIQKDEDEDSKGSAAPKAAPKAMPKAMPKASPVPTPKPMTKSRPSYGDPTATFSGDENSYDEEDEDEDEPPFKRMRSSSGMKATAKRQPLADLSVNAPAPTAKVAKKTGQLPRGYDPTVSSGADLDPNRTVVNLSPEAVFSELIDKASEYVTQKKKVSLYGDFIAKYGRDKLFEFTKNSIKPELWGHFLEGDKATDLEFLRSLPGEKKFPDRPGWYLAIVEDRESGEAEFLAVYIGQSASIIARIGGMKGHKQSVLQTKKNGLLYWFWRGDTNAVPPIPTSISLEQKLARLPRKCKFITLGTDQSQLQGEDADDFRNIVEMFLALMFRSLQLKDLKTWLPGDCVLASPATGANVQLPILQGHSGSNFALGGAMASDNPSVASYAQSALGNNLSAEHQQRRDRVKMEKTTTGSREKGKNQDHFRGANLALGDAVEVEVACVECGWTKTDTQPQYLKKDGKYLARLTACQQCPASEAARKRGQKHPAKQFNPVHLTEDQFVIKNRLKFDD